MKDNLFALIVGLLLGVLACEIALRIYTVEYWYPEAIADTKARPVRQRPPDGPAILLLGDSYAYGSGIERDEDTLAGQLQLMSGIPVINGGIPGSLTNAWRIRAECEANRPLLAVIVSWSPRDGTLAGVGGMFAITRDIGNGETFCGPSKTCRLLADRYTRLLISKHYSRALNTGYREGMPEWEQAKQNLKLIREEVAPAPVLFVSWPALIGLRGGYPLEPVRDALTAWSAQEGLPTVDLLPAFQGRQERLLWVSSTDQHPNAMATQIAAQAILPQLIEVMQ